MNIIGKYSTEDLLQEGLVETTKLILRKTLRLLYIRKQLSGLITTDDKLNILFVVPYMVAGGAEKVILNIANSVDKDGISFHIITTVPTTNVWKCKFEHNFKNIIIANEYIGNGDIFKKYLFDIICKLKIDVIVISNSELGYKYIKEIKSRFNNIKVIDIVHAVEAVHGLSGLDGATPHIDKRICISNQIKEFLLRRYNSNSEWKVYGERLQVIPNGTDMIEYNPFKVKPRKFKSKYNIADEAKIVTFVGRFSEEKNPLMFVEIARIVLSRIHDCNKVVFVMAGDGPELNFIKETVKVDGLDARIIFTGLIDNVQELLIDTKILLITSKNEGIPLVIAEAMAMMVPVISTDVGGVREIIVDDVNGYIIEREYNIEDEVKKFTDKIIYLLTYEEKRTVMGKKGYDIVEKLYSLDSMGKKYLNLFNTL